MNRRGFLSLLAPAAAALIVPELLVPKRKIFLPPPGGWPNRIYGESWIDSALRMRGEAVDYAMGCDATVLSIYHGGRVILVRDFKTTDVLGIEHDGSQVRYLKNGELLRAYDV